MSKHSNARNLILKTKMTASKDQKTWLFLICFKMSLFHRQLNNACLQRMLKTVLNQYNFLKFIYGFKVWLKLIRITTKITPMKCSSSLLTKSQLNIGFKNWILLRKTKFRYFLSETSYWNAYLKGSQTSTMVFAYQILHKTKNLFVQFHCVLLSFIKSKKTL